MIVGLTGGIGSGKTKACEFFTNLGVHIEDADEISRQLTNPEHKNYALICKKFNQFCSRGILDRRALRSHIAKHSVDKIWLENLLHPQIITTLTNNLNQAISTKNYAILASPLLLEIEQLKKLTDRILLIDVPTEIQLSRASFRDGVNSTQIQEILRLQMPREQKIKLADDIIDNSTNLPSLKSQVESFHKKYLAMTKKI